MRLVTCLAAATLLAACGPSTGATPTFTKGPCGFQTAAGERVTCGDVAVPARHASPNGPAYALRVAEFQSATAKPGALPVILLLGGPGDTVASYAPAFTSQLMNALGHEIVVFDQRGTGRSTPAPACTSPPSLFAAPSTVAKAFTACRDTLKAGGTDLASFDTLENADDVDEVRQALGIDTYVLVGWSYGTRLALQVLRRHPASIAGVVLDSVTTPDELPPDTKPPLVDAALSSLVQACAADSACNAAHPNLDSKIAATTAALPVDWAGSVSGKFTRAMYGALLTQTMARSTKPLADVPAYVDRIDGLVAGGGPMPAGSTQDLASAVDAAHFPKVAMYTSMTCGDDQDADPAKAKAALVGIRPALAAYYQQVDDVTFAVCKVWPYEAHPASDFTAVSSSLPSLLFTTRYDTLATEAWAAHAARTLPSSTLVRFTDAAHIVEATDPSGCALSILKQFLDDPKATLDASCAH